MSGQLRPPGLRENPSESAVARLSRGVFSWRSVTRREALVTGGAADLQKLLRSLYQDPAKIQRLRVPAALLAEQS